MQYSKYRLFGPKFSTILSSGQQIIVWKDEKRVVKLGSYGVQGFGTQNC
jgi:hypothetical protein